MNIILFSCGVVLFLTGYLLVGCIFYNVAVRSLSEEAVVAALIVRKCPVTREIVEISMNAARRHLAWLIVNWPGYLLTFKN